MTSPVYFRQECVQFNNMHFANLLSYALDVGARMPKSRAEQTEYDRIKNMQETGQFWPGRGMTIEKDFVTEAVRKFWANVFFNLSEAVFAREIGNQTNTEWQTTMIYFAQGVARLFVKAAQETDRRWYPDKRANAAAFRNKEKSFE